jgi:hypothetical protein
MAQYLANTFAASWPGLSRPSTTFFFTRKITKTWMPGTISAFTRVFDALRPGMPADGVEFLS